MSSLLPGATTAGLAAAFEERRSQLASSVKHWQICVMVSLGVLCLLAAAEISYGRLADPQLTLHDLSGIAVRRVLVVGPLIWLIFYASRQAGTAKQLEEDYAFKEAASRSFEGYKKQLAEIELAAGANTAVRTFCENTLKILADPPGRVYEKRRPDITPLSALSEAAPELSKLATSLSQALHALQPVRPYLESTAVKDRLE